MPKKSIEERALMIALSPNPTSTSLDPGPAPSYSNPKTALRRCCAAWQRSFDAYMEQNEYKTDSDNIFAAKEAGEAYRNAKPMLSGYEGVCEFLACAAHGILIGAIPRDKSGQLLYAAQIALNTLPHQPSKQHKQSSKTHSPLPPSQKALSARSKIQKSHVQ